MSLEWDIPIMGVNVGGLGFLTEITQNDLAQIEELLAQPPSIQTRIVLTVSVVQKRKKRRIFKGYAVNEVTIMRRIDAPMLNLHIQYAGMSLPHYKADGILVATPTGSTAYNLSINGPILFPTEHSMVLNALAPHALTNRPLVLPSAYPIEVRLKEGGRATISIDGRRPIAFETDDYLEIKQADHFLKFVTNPRRTYFDVLAQKLHFGRRD